MRSRSRIRSKPVLTMGATISSCAMPGALPPPAMALPPALPPPASAWSPPSPMSSRSSVASTASSNVSTSKVSQVDDTPPDLHGIADEYAIMAEDSSPPDLDLIGRLCEDLETLGRDAHYSQFGDVSRDCLAAFVAKSNAFLDIDLGLNPNFLVRCLYQSPISIWSRDHALAVVFWLNQILIKIHRVEKVSRPVFAQMVRAVVSVAALLPAWTHNTMFGRPKCPENIRMAENECDECSNMANPLSPSTPPSTAWSVSPLSQVFINLPGVFNNDDYDLSSIESVIDYSRMSSYANLITPIVLALNTDWSISYLKTQISKNDGAWTFAIVEKMTQFREISSFFEGHCSDCIKEQNCNAICMNFLSVLTSSNLQYCRDMAKKRSALKMVEARATILLAGIEPEKFKLLLQGSSVADINEYLEAAIHWLIQIMQNKQPEPGSVKSELRFNDLIVTMKAICMLLQRKREEDYTVLPEPYNPFFNMYAENMFWFVSVDLCIFDLQRLSRTRDESQEISSVTIYQRNPDHIFSLLSKLFGVARDTLSFSKRDFFEARSMFILAVWTAGSLMTTNFFEKTTHKTRMDLLRSVLANPVIAKLRAKDFENYLAPFIRNFPSSCSEVDASEESLALQFLTLIDTHAQESISDELLRLILSTTMTKANSKTILEKCPYRYIGQIFHHATKCIESVGDLDPSPEVFLQGQNKFSGEDQFPECLSSPRPICDLQVRLLKGIFEICVKRTNIIETYLLPAHHICPQPSLGDTLVLIHEVLLWAESDFKTSGCFASGKNLFMLAFRIANRDLPKIFFKKHSTEPILLLDRFLTHPAIAKITDSDFRNDLRHFISRFSQRVFDSNEPLGQCIAVRCIRFVEGIPRQIWTKLDQIIIQEITTERNFGRTLENSLKTNIVSLVKIAICNPKIEVTCWKKFKTECVVELEFASASRGPIQKKDYYTKLLHGSQREYDRMNGITRRRQLDEIDGCPVCRKGLKTPSSVKWKPVEDRGWIVTFHK